MTRHDLRELAALTALGLLLGLGHLALRPELPLLAAPAAECSVGEPPAILSSEPLSSEPELLETRLDGGAR